MALEFLKYRFMDKIKIELRYRTNSSTWVLYINSIGFVVSEAIAKSLIKGLRLQEDEINKTYFYTIENESIDTNIGTNNTGRFNSGHKNTGDYNTGDSNTGNYNSGNYNIGDRNSGNWNSGKYNSGHDNSGHFNSGNGNRGISNSGNCNSGNYNCGSNNSGDWNWTDRSSGVFNTEEAKIMMFNKPSDWTYSDWNYSPARSILSDLILNKWVLITNMTEEEKIAHPLADVCGGYLKTFTYKEACNNLWLRLDKNSKKIITSLPNFDAQVFRIITGIEI